MKKRRLRLLIGISVILTMLIGGGIVYMVHQHQVKKEQEHQKMVAIATSEEAKKIYEKHMRANDPMALTDDGIIKSYEIDTDSLYYNPMGGMEVRIYFNHDKDLDFHFGLVESDDGKYESSGYTISPKLSALLKEGTNE